MILLGDEHISAERKILRGYNNDSIKQGVNEREMIKQRCFCFGNDGWRAKSVFDPWEGLRTLCDSGVSYTAEAKSINWLSLYARESDEAQLKIARRYSRTMHRLRLRTPRIFKSRKLKKGMAKKAACRNSKLCNKTYYYIDSGNSYVHDIPACIFLAGFDP